MNIAFIVATVNISFMTLLKFSAPEHSSWGGHRLQLALCGNNEHRFHSRDSQRIIILLLQLSAPELCSGHRLQFYAVIPMNIASTVSLSTHMYSVVRSILL